MSVQTEIDRIKGNIADSYTAVSQKGGTLPEEQVSGSLAEAIRSIPTGSAPETPLDPVQVYRDTRPADWLPMPEPQDNEMYLLFLIPDGVSSLLAFTVTCTGNYTVALGTVSNGVFVQQSSVSLASDAKYEAELFASDFGNLTSDGFKQVMVKISGTNILTWSPSTHSKKIAPANYTKWNIVDFACKLPHGTKVALRGNESLRYFAWYGVNQLTAAGDMFRDCTSLIAVLYLETGSVTNAGAMFVGCRSLVAIPQFNTENVTNMNLMFQACNSLKTIPLINSAKASTNSMFNDCYSLKSVPKLDISKSTNTIYMFRACENLSTIPKLTIGKITNSFDMFAGCNMLSSVAFDPSVVDWEGTDISLSDCSLGHQALVNLFESLPTITDAHTLTLSGNPGVPELTDEEKAVAAGKNWTLAL